MDTIDVQAKYIVTNPLTPKKTASQTTQWAVAATGPKILDEVTIVWPTGHAGTTGIRLNYNGLTILPWNQPTAFLIDDGRERVFKLGLYVATNIQVVTQNNDNAQHRHYLTAKLLEYVDTTSIARASIPEVIR